MSEASPDDIRAKRSRRSVVKAGTKLVYAAPLVAATTNLGASPTAAQLITPGQGGAEECSGNQSPKQCPEGGKVQYTCKSTTTCPAELQADVEVKCRADGTPYCQAKGVDLTSQGCLPLLCANQAG
jgi:hypothetical protein